MYANVVNPAAARRIKEWGDTAYRDRQSRGRAPVASPETFVPDPPAVRFNADAIPGLADWIATVPDRPGFLGDMKLRVLRGESLSERQFETLERIFDEAFDRAQDEWAARAATRRNEMGRQEAYCVPADEPPAIPCGYYTVETEQFGHVTLRLRLGQQGYSKGKAIIGYLNGPNNETSYTNVGYVFGKRVAPFRSAGPIPPRIDAAIAYLLSKGEDYEFFGKAYATESGNCYVCGRLLTDPVSIELGIGPVCRAGGE